jgi:type IV secretion system protein VirB3
MPEHRVFKGATRPALVVGVPLVPMVVLSLTTLLPLAWFVLFQLYLLSFLLLTIFLTVYLWMRSLTNKDPWRTKQELLRLRVRLKKGNQAIWGGISYGPGRLKKRSP